MPTEKLVAQPVFHSDNAELLFLPEAEILYLTWKKTASSAAIQEAYEYLYRQMQNRQVKYVLIDIGQRGPASEADEIWIMQDFVPRLVHSFQEGLFLAYLLNASHYRQLQTESPNGSMESLSQMLSINYFRDEPAALAWLKAKQ